MFAKLLQLISDKKKKDLFLSLVKYYLTTQICIIPI